MSIHKFPKKECECPICEIFEMYFSDILSAESPEELESVVRDVIHHSFNNGMISAIEQDVANKIEFLESVDLD